MKLTPKQQEIYNLIVELTQRQGYPPSVRELGEAMGLKSPSTVHFHLKGLERAGAISKDAGKTRAITLRNAPSAVLKGKIPLLGYVAAGAPILAEELIEEYISFDTDAASDEHFALRVRGESMLDAGICPGDLVVVRRGSQVHNGDIVVALFENEATVKVYSRTPAGIRLLPRNADYPPIDGTHAEVLGKVIGLARRY